MSQRISMAQHDFAETRVQTQYSGAVPLALRQLSMPPHHIDIDLAPQTVVQSCASGWGRFFSRRPEPTLFQRCLAVHIAAASEMHGRRY